MVASMDASLIVPRMPEAVMPGVAPSSVPRPPQIPDDDSDDEASKEAEETTEQYLQKSFDSFVQKREDWSKRIWRLGLGIDRYLGGQTDLDEPNQSYARIRLAETWLEGDGLINGSDLKFRLDLPSTRRKYRLIFENDTEDQSTLNNKAKVSGLTDATLSNIKRDDLSAAVRVALDDLANWKSDFDVGIRGSMPLDPFARHNLRRRWELGQDWNFQMRQQAGYFKSKGYFYDLLGSFDRFLEPDLAARWNTEVKWEQDEDYLQFGSTLSIVRYLDERHLLDHSFGINGQGADRRYVDLYYFAVTHRTLLYKDWLSLDLVPEIRFPRERDFNETLAFTVRLEVLFFQNNPFNRR